MESSARHARLGLGAVCALFVLTMGIMAVKSVEARREAGISAPDFVLQDVNAKEVALSSYRGKVVVLLFGNLGGEYTQRFVDFADRYAGDGRVQVLCIDTPLPGQEPRSLRELRVLKNVTDQKCPVLADREGRAARLYGVSSLPTVCVIDAAGHVRYRGAFDDNRIESLVHQHDARDAVARLLEARPAELTMTQATARLK
jgi:peroxiredoxin